MKKRFFWVIISVITVAIIVLLFKNFKNTRQFMIKIDKESLSALLNNAKELEGKNDLQGARAVYQKLTASYPHSPQVSQWQKKAEDLSIKLLFSPVIIKGSILYEIKPGDNLTKIAQQSNTTVEFLMKANNLDRDRILPGRKIKIYNQPFSIVVDKSQNILILKSNEEVIKPYVVSSGANNSTPTGNFKITSKLQNPTWFKAGAVVSPGSPENILGSRWLGLDLRGYGIHGTTDPQSLGRQVTQGCIRMSNQDIEELYIIVPLKTEVIIVD